MKTSTSRDLRCAGIPTGDRNRDSARVLGRTRFAAPGVPFGPCFDLIGWVKTGLLFATILVAVAALVREAHAHPTAVLLSNGAPPPSSRALLVVSEATGTIVNAAPRTREWMARHEQPLPRQETDATAVLDDEARVMSAQYMEMEPLSPGAVQTQDALAAHGEKPVWGDAGRSLVGAWSSCFGAMPVPPVAPTDGVDSGASRAPASNGEQMLADRIPADRSLVHVSARNADAPVPVDRGFGAREESTAHAHDAEMLGDATADPPAADFDHGGGRAEAAESYADQSADYRSPSMNERKTRVESTPTIMSACLRLALSEPISSWGSRRCDARQGR